MRRETSSPGKSIVLAVCLEPMKGIVLKLWRRQKRNFLGKQSIKIHVLGRVLRETPFSPGAENRYHDDGDNQKEEYVASCLGDSNLKPAIGQMFHL